MMSRWLLPLFAIACLLAGGTGGLARADEPQTGEQIYAAQCARCHGKAGEGTEEQPDPLIGDKLIPELAALIDKTMPEGAPEKLNADESQRVAAYIHEAFYSPVAQARNQPVRIELSRLTVRQYQNALTDLIGSFRGASQWSLDTTAEHGLKGEYFKGRQPRGGERIIDRVDPQVKFDFGEEAPDEKLEAHQFSIAWEGSVLAPETGDYEFIVRTEHAARLWVNDLRDPLIDAWVKSGNDTEYRQSIRLLGGRPYSLRLEFSKAKQGVDDSDKNKDKPPPKVKASIALEWKLPHLPAETIPARCLSPKTTSELFVVTTPFPPDDRSIGYERGTTISKAWDQATTDAAIETAVYVADRLDELTGIRQRERGQSGRRRRRDGESQDQTPQISASDRDAKLRDFCRKFAERAFRRPLTDEQRQVYIDQQFTKAETPEAAVKRVVLLVLKSPRFLYREIGAASDELKPDAYDVASRLSFVLWDSLPDDELLKAAAEGQLATHEQIAAQAERMLADLRTRAKVRQFFLQWLKIEQVPDMVKNPERYPEFNEAVAADLRTSLDLFLEQTIWSEKSDFRELLLAESLPLNGRLAGLYGAELAADAPFEKVALAGTDRAGLLSHPYLLAAFAYTETTSPIHRGVFISRSLLGRALKPPPIAVSPLSPDVHKDLTTRERVALQTNSAACMLCHGMINPLGFTLEHYDAIGRYRAEEQGKAIDAKGKYLTRAGDTVEFAGVRDLAKFLADSEETHTAFVQQLFHYLVKQPVRAYGPDRLNELKAAFRQNEFNIRKLVATMAASAAQD
jgi:cytochrome c553